MSSSKRQAIIRACLAGALMLVAFAFVRAQTQNPPANEGADKAPAAQEKRVFLVETPNGGIQPQAVVDSRGIVHLLYFKGEPAAGDLFYVRRDPGKTEFSAPIRVNSQKGSAIAIGTSRGGQLGVGKNGRVHVAWNGSARARPRGPGKYNSPMLYSRLTDAGKSFEEQRNLMRITETLDGGGTLAADQAGNVYVAWHAQKFGSGRGEGDRKVWLALSTDEGKTFAEERPINTKPTGACGCCGMRAFVDGKGTAYFVYRTATNGNQRDTFLLATRDVGKHFLGNVVHKWEINACPMSSEALAEGPDGVVYTAWETDGSVYFAPIKPGTTQVGEPVAAPGAGKARKHPSLTVNSKDELILVWTEDTGWQRGGALAWQVFDKKGRPTKERGRLRGGVPVWGLPAVVAGANGTFTVFH
jgi:hypothetical protein